MTPGSLDAVEGPVDPGIDLKPSLHQARDGMGRPSVSSMRFSWMWRDPCGPLGRMRGIRTGVVRDLRSREI